MSTDIPMEKTENLDIGSQIRLIHQDMRHRFDLVDNKLDALRSEHNTLRDRTESRLESMQSRVVELEAKIREKDVMYKILVGAASAPGIGAALKAFLG